MSRKKTTEEFIKEANIIHNNYYDYSKSIYSGSNEKIEVICPKHGSFFQRAAGHLGGKGCSSCVYDRLHSLFVKDFAKFVEEANIIHDNLFSYDQSIYINTNSKIEIFCPKHNILFWQPHQFIYAVKDVQNAERKNKK